MTLYFKILWINAILMNLVVDYPKASVEIFRGFCLVAIVTLESFNYELLLEIGNRHRKRERIFSVA